MGGNASPLIADLTLSVIEFKYLKEQPRMPTDAFVARYIDDIVEINVDLEHRLPQIYPPELEVNKDSPDTYGRINYLDLQLTVGERYINIFDKTENFDFHVVKTINSSSCIHSNTIIGIMMGQFIRYARVITKYDDFYNRCLRMLRNHKDAGHAVSTLTQALTRFAGRYEANLYRYGLGSQRKVLKQFVSKLVNELQ